MDASLRRLCPFRVPDLVLGIVPDTGRYEPSPQPRSRATLTIRFHGTVNLDPAKRVGRDASRIADEVIAHLAGQVGAEVTVTLEVEAKLPGGA